MGYVIGYDRLAKKLAETRSPERVAYDNLIASQDRLFGEQEPSFLEKILGDRPDHIEHRLRPVIEASESPLAMDVLETRFADFKRYDGAQYEQFIIQAMTYYHNFDKRNIRAIDRLVGVARHLFRYQAGLPSLSDLAEINARTDGRIKRWRYSRKEKKVEDRLKRFKTLVLYRTD
jgi:hypothetical protein